MVVVLVSVWVDFLKLIFGFCGCGLLDCEWIITARKKIKYIGDVGGLIRSYSTRSRNYWGTLSELTE